MGLSVAVAQGAIADPGSRPTTWHIGGGFSEPSGQITDYLQGGWVAHGGFTYAPNGSALGLRGDLSLSSHQASNKFLDYGTNISGIQVDSGTGSVASLSLGPEYRVPLIGGSHLYGFAQVGVYRTSLQLTQTALFSGYYCDAYFGFCDSAVTVGDNLVYDETRTRLGWNVGLGVDFPSRTGLSYFIESSYHRISGPQGMNFVPIEVGIRF